MSPGQQCRPEPGGPAPSATGTDAPCEAAPHIEDQPLLQEGSALLTGNLGHVPGPSWLVTEGVEGLRLPLEPP